MCSMFYCIGPQINKKFKATQTIPLSQFVAFVFKDVIVVVAAAVVVVVNATAGGKYSRIFAKHCFLIQPTSCVSLFLPRVI